MIDSLSIFALSAKFSLQEIPKVVLGGKAGFESHKLN